MKIILDMSMVFVLRFLFPGRDRARSLSIIASIQVHVFPCRDFRFHPCFFFHEVWKCQVYALGSGPQVAWTCATISKINLRPPGLLTSSGRSELAQCIRLRTFGIRRRTRDPHAIRVARASSNMRAQVRVACAHIPSRPFGYDQV